MKNLILSFCFLLSFQSLMAQYPSCDGNRYKNIAFTAVDSSIGVQYGQNTTMNNVQQDLFMDVYEPAGDTATKRPLILYIHGGGFYQGSRQEGIGLCMLFAYKGFVTATIDYRLIDVPLTDSLVVAEGMIQAISDAKAAIRYFVEDAAGNNLLKVDTNLIFVAGGSAGGITANQIAYLDAGDAIPAYFQNLLNNNGGFTGNSSSNTNHSTPVKAVINYSGGLWRKEWISASEPALFSVHETGDTLVPCLNGTSDAFQFPVYFDGSCLMHQEADAKGIHNELYSINSNGHGNYFSTPLVIDTVLKKTSAFLYNIICNHSPNWPAIKANATFFVPDTNYATPQLQPIQVGGWEDGLFMTRDGKHLFSTYLPMDVFSWLGDFLLSPVCFNFNPYFRPPLLDIDTLTNPWSCPNFIHSDIILSSRSDTGLAFAPWMNSNLQTPLSFDGGAHGILLNPDTFDVFVYTRDGVGSLGVDIMLMKNAPINANTASAVPILSTTSYEDNPHIERLGPAHLLLFFDRDRYIYYAESFDDGDNWNNPVLVSNILNDQAPYDVQPHLWNDGTDWWVYFCANNPGGIRCIYKSKQMIAGNWDSWGPRQLVIEPAGITGNHGTIFGVGEPTLTTWGDLSFVVVYGDIRSTDTTDTYDCDPWIMKRKHPIITNHKASQMNVADFYCYPNPGNKQIRIHTGSKIPELVSLEIFNAMGTLLKSIRVQSDAAIDISDLAKGMYWIKCAEHPQKIVRFIKQ